MADASYITKFGHVVENEEWGSFNIVFGSAEQWLTDRWKKALQFGTLHCIDVLVVDEVHTVETWYVAFHSFIP